MTILRTVILTYFYPISGVFLNYCAKFLTKVLSIFPMLNGIIVWTIQVSKKDIFPKITFLRLANQTSL